MLVVDASVDGLGGLEQRQKDVTVQPLCFFSLCTLPNKINWSATELEMDTAVWAVKKNRPSSYGVPCEVCSDHQPLRNSFSLA